MVSNIISRLKLQDWREVNLKSFNDCYIIAIKDKSFKKDTVNVDCVNKITFELGIDCGIKNNPLTISYFTLDFNDITSGNNELNKITAFTRLVNIPNTFYIRAVAIQTDNGQIDKGETSISVNVNAIDLG